MIIKETREIEDMVCWLDSQGWNIAMDAGRDPEDSSLKITYIEIYERSTNKTLYYSEEGFNITKGLKDIVDQVKAG